MEYVHNIFQIVEIRMQDAKILVRVCYLMHAIN